MKRQLIRYVVKIYNEENSIVQALYRFTGIGSTTIFGSIPNPGKQYRYMMSLVGTRPEAGLFLMYQ